MPPRQCHKDMRVRTTTICDDLGVSKEKNRSSLDGCLGRWPRLRKAAMELPRTRRVGAEPLPPQQQNITRTRSLRALWDKDIRPNALCANPLGFAHCRLAARKTSDEEKGSSWMQAVDHTETESTLAVSVVDLIKCFDRIYRY